MKRVLLLTDPGTTGSFVRSMIGAFSGTFSASSNGFSSITAGEITSGPCPVVNVVVCAGAAFPATSVTPAIATVISVLSGNGACGTNTTFWLLLLKLIASATAVTPPLLSWIVPAFAVSGFTGSLNVTSISALSPTFTAPLGGDTEMIAGATVSGFVPVTKKATSCVNGSAIPFVPCNPALICTKYSVFGANGVLGV